MRIICSLAVLIAIGMLGVTLSPHHAHAQTSSNLSVQVVPAASGGCAATGSDAQADLATAGFTTCVIGNDFTQPIPNTAGTGLPANWLNCNGDSTSAVWYWGAGGWSSPPLPPCVSGPSANSSNSSVYQATDPVYGNTTLVLHNSSAASCPNGNGCVGNVVTIPFVGWDRTKWPNNGLFPSSYVEITARTENPEIFNTFAMWSAINAGEQQRVMGPISDCCWWGHEIDQMIEGLRGGRSIEGILWHNPNPGSQPDSRTNCGGAGGACINSYVEGGPGPLDTASHTYGVLSTTDGNGHFSDCAYFDGLRQGCHTTSYLDSGDQNERRWLTFGTGYLDHYQYIKSVKVIACDSWKSTMCHTPLVGTAVNINGGTNTTVSHGATITATVSKAAKNPQDVLSVCVPNPQSWPDCGGTYSFAYNTSGQGSWSTSLTAPSSPGNYIVGYLPGGCVSCMSVSGAFAALTVQ